MEKPLFPGAMQIEKLTAEITGDRISYFRAGAGPPLLLLHGLLGGSFCWRRNMEALSQCHTVFAVDLPGHGESDAPCQLDCSMGAQAGRVSALLEELKLQEVDVVGCSWGGAIAILLAAQSAKVRSLVLAAPVNPWSNFGAGRIQFLIGHVGAAFLRTIWPVSRPLYRIALARMYGDPGQMPPGTVEGYRSQIMRPGRVNNILNTLRSWEKDVNTLRAEIPKIKARSLLIWGTRDGAVDVRSAEALKQALPQCQLKIIEGAGHLPFEETPEEFNRLVLDFIDQDFIDQQKVPPMRGTICKAL
jgi:pimeloyl-ACP methyl ester carboxylesterase